MGEFDLNLASWKAKQPNPETARLARLTPTGDCNTCPLSKPLNSKIKGTRIDGSFGKCVNPAGPCENPTPRKGIDKATSTFKRKG